VRDQVAAAIQRLAAAAATFDWERGLWSTLLTFVIDRLAQLQFAIRSLKQALQDASPHAKAASIVAAVHATVLSNAATLREASAELQRQQENLRAAIAGSRTLTSVRAAFALADGAAAEIEALMPNVVEGLRPLMLSAKAQLINAKSLLLAAVDREEAALRTLEADLLKVPISSWQRRWSSSLSYRARRRHGSRRSLRRCASR
jgi:hypothetical protein